MQGDALCEKTPEIRKTVHLRTAVVQKQPVPVAADCHSYVVTGR